MNDVDLVEVLHRIIELQIILRLLEVYDYLKIEGVSRTVNDMMYYIYDLKKGILLIMVSKGYSKYIPRGYTFYMITSPLDEFIMYDNEVMSRIKHIPTITKENIVNELVKYARYFKSISSFSTRIGEDAYMIAKRIAQLVYKITRGNVDIRSEIY